MLSQYEVHELNAILGAELSAGTSTERRSGKWKCKVSEMLVGEYLIVPLITAQMLKSEENVMHNCCRKYAHQCEDLKYSIFSIRTRSGEHQATLGLAMHEGYWCFDKCLGHSNIKVLEETLNYIDEEGVLQTEFFLTEIYYVAHEVVRLMNCTSSNH